MFRETNKLRHWVDPSRIEWYELSENPHPQAIAMLEQHPNKIKWFNLSKNPSAIHILEKNLQNTCRTNILLNPSAKCLGEKYKERLDYWKYLCEYANYHQIRSIEDHISEVDEVVDLVKSVNTQRANSTPVYVYVPMYVPTSHVNWNTLSMNPYAIHILEKNMDKIDWLHVSINPSSRALHLLEQHPENIRWKHLCSNKNKLARHLLETYPENICWKQLSLNESSWAIEFLERHPDKIEWSFLSKNSHPHAIALLEKHPDKIDWIYLSRNTHPRAVEILEQHPERIAWCFFSKNPQLFVWNEEYDYETMKRNKQPLHQELIQAVFHPKNLSKFEFWGFECGFDAIDTSTL